MTDDKYAEARMAHAERLAAMRAKSRCIKDYIDPAEQLHPPRRRSRRRVHRSGFMGGAGLPSAHVGEQRADLPPLSQDQIADMETTINKG